MNGAVKTTAAVGQSVALCQILLWVIWKATGVVIPQEVSLPFIVAFSPIIHAIMTAIEKRLGIDIVPNGATTETKP